MFHEWIAPRMAMGEALVEEGKERLDLLVLDADVCTSTQTHLFRKAYPDRFIQAGIAEANMVGMAAGLSLMGFTPFLSTFACFVSKRMLDQIAISIAYPRLNVKINGAYGGVSTGKAGATHQSFEDLAIMRAIPDMKVLCPGDGPETRSAVRLALDTDGPVYLRTVRCEVPTLFPDPPTLAWGKGVALRSGNDVSIVSTGMMTSKALEAAEILEKEGVSARVLHMPSIKPMDEAMLIQASQETHGIVTVENHSVIGGLGGAVAEVVSEHAPCYVLRVGTPDVFGESGDDEEFFTKYKMNVEHIAEAARRVMERR